MYWPKRYMAKFSQRCLFQLGQCWQFVDKPTHQPHHLIPNVALRTLLKGFTLHCKTLCDRYQSKKALKDVQAYILDLHISLWQCLAYVYTTYIHGGHYFHESGSGEKLWTWSLVIRYFFYHRQVSLLSCLNEFIRPFNYYINRLS